jgi:ribonuclease P protein component
MQPQHRLRETAAFERARRRGRTWGNALLVLNAVRADPPLTRCGFVVSRRVGKAVERNRVKRRLREILRRRLPAMVPGWDLVFSARPATASAPYARLAEAIDDLLRRAELLTASAPPAPAGRAPGEASQPAGATPAAAPTAAPAEAD